MLYEVITIAGGSGPDLLIGDDGDNVFFFTDGWGQDVVRVRFESFDAVLDDVQRVGSPLGKPVADDVGFGSLSAVLGVPDMNWLDRRRPLALARITSYNVCYTKLLRSPASETRGRWGPGRCRPSRLPPLPH